MKNALFTTLMIFFLSNVVAQERKFNIVFESGQTTLAEKQKKEMNTAASKLTPGETVIFYPMIYDSSARVFKYMPNAKGQASAIAEYGKTLGFELIGTPGNFPGAYSGMSVGVLMKYKKGPAKPGKPAPLQGKGIKGHYPEKPSQFFIIDPLRDTIIVGNEGTRLYFKSGCLLTRKQVQIELKEFYKLEDYIKNGLPTTSNGNLIETGGSIYLDARENDAGKKQVRINPTTGVGADFTIGKNDPEMQVFIKDPKFPNQTNWILPPLRTVTQTFRATETIYGPDDKVISQKKFNTKEEWEKHLKEEEKKAEEEAQKEKERQKKEAIRQETANKMDGKLAVYDLGYINCDKFYDEPTMPLVVKADEKITAEYYLVYTDLRGVMKADVNAGQVSFSSVAKNRKAVLIGVCFVDKQAYYFKGSVAPGGKLATKVALKPVEETFLNQQLALLK